MPEESGEVVQLRGREIPMQVHRLADAVGAVVHAEGRAKAEIDRVYAADRMSDLLNGVSDATLLVTNLVNSGLTRLIELMDAPAVCLLNGVTPDSDLLEAARRHHTLLMVSPHGMFETCGRLYAALRGSTGEGDP